MANVRRIPESERWDADGMFETHVAPWSPDGSDSSRNGQACGDGASLPSRSAGGKQSSEDLPSQSRLGTMWPQRRLPWVPVLDKWSGATAQAHSEACWRRIERLLKGDSSGSARLAAADERLMQLNEMRPRIQE